MRRQLEVLRAYIRAGSVAAAYELGIGGTTARQYLSGLYRRTGCLNAPQAACLLGARRLGLGAVVSPGAAVDCTSSTRSMEGRVSDAMTASPADVEWTVTVTEPLPDCPSVEACWQKLATQTTWGGWRSASKMRGDDVVTTLVPPATEPLAKGDEYVVRVGRFMTIRCRVLESSSPGTSTAAGGEAVFDATGVALGGIVKARFRFTVFRGEDGVVMARAQERIRSLPLLAPSEETLEAEHRHTFRDLNASFLSTRRT